MQLTEFGIDAKDLAWLLKKSAELVTTKGSPIMSPQDVMKLLHESFDSLVTQDNSFRELIMTLAFIKLLEILTEVNTQMIQELPEEVKDKLSKELQDMVETVLKG